MDASSEGTQRSVDVFGLFLFESLNLSFEDSFTASQVNKHKFIGALVAPLLRNPLDRDHTVRSTGAIIQSV